MQRILVISLLLGVVFIWVVPTPAVRVAPIHTAGIYFDDSDPNLIVLGSPNYEVGLRKSNGSIQYITDKSTGKIVTPGSRNECLWGGVFLVNKHEEFTGGCNYNAAWNDHFNYSFNTTLNRLTLTYSASPQMVRRIDAVVLIQGNADNAFDMQLQVANNSVNVMDRALFPCDLVFNKSEIEEALLPVMPGVVLEPDFFAQNRSYKVKYPGYPGAFASFTAIKTTQGQFALYDLYGTGPLRETWLGFWNDNAIPPYIAGSTTLTHEFAASTPGGQSWSSPWVRVRVGQSFVQAIQGYRADNGISDFTSLRQKLGSRYDTAAQAPLYKIDTVEMNLPFSRYAADVLAQVPTPGILHPVAFQPGGHDQSYPDFIPPDPRWGTTSDLAAMFRAAQARGFLVMPYTNPTWWDNEGPTLTHLPSGTTLAGIGVIGSDDSPVFETYGPNGGYVVSPRAPFVLNRLGQLMRDLTITVPSDMVFEDQVGARAWLEDTNPSAKGPLDYIDGWIEHTRLYQDKLLHTELGFDRLAETEVGFHGSVLQPLKFGYTPDWWGSGTWHAYPLATMLARDKTLFYQHDLSTETFTTSKEMLSWNMAFGYQLSYNLVTDGLGGGLNSQWLQVVSVFQKYALASYADEPITNFETLVPGVTRTTFQTCAVTANTSASQSYASTGYTLPPQGSMVLCPNSGLTAGVFSAFNGQPLSPGDHYLVEQRSPGKVTIWQPIGGETSLTFKSLPAWQPGEALLASAYTSQGQLIGSLPLTVSEQSVRITYPKTLNNQGVGSIRLTWPVKQVFLPTLRR